MAFWSSDGETACDCAATTCGIKSRKTRVSETNRTRIVQSLLVCRRIRSKSGTTVAGSVYHDREIFASKVREEFSMPIEIRRKDLKTLVAQGRAQLVEVLPASAYKKEHLPQAVNIPLEIMNSETTRTLRKDQAVIVYCADYQCDLSARAGWRLESMGFQEVYRYTPGKADWLAAGWETEGTEAKKVRIRQMIHKEVPTCSLRERLEDVKARRRPNQDFCVVVNDRNIVLGIIQGDTWDANPLARVADVMQPGPQTIRPALEPKDAQKVLRHYDGPNAIVTTSDGELLGLIKIAQKKAHKEHEAA